MATTQMPKPMMKRRGLLAIVLIAVVLIAAGLGYYLYQSRSTSTAPTVTSTAPVYSATNSPINTKILVTFSTAMDPTTITKTTFTLKHGTTSDAGTVSYVGVTAIFIPSANFATNTVYTATITTGAKDSAGHALAVDFVWSFTTGVLADTTPPTVIGTSPVLAVAVDSSISATFSKAMDPSTITTTTFTMAQGSTSLPGTVIYAGTTATFKPSTSLAANTTYTATITTGVKDLSGNALQTNFVWSFTTATSTSSCAQTAVSLGTAANFEVLAGSGVTNTGNTIVTGNLGVSPGTAVTGFPPGTVSGTTSIGVASAAGTGQGDLTTAYNNAQGLTLCPITVSGDLGGLTLTPGLYKSTSSLAITGTLTLDAQGNANAVFIFQIASTLTTASGSSIVLANGAQASNVFWAVGSSATLGTYSLFKGTIMAYASITITTGAELDGRALARVAAVTMDSNTVRPS
jgi:flagellar basal body-associated protein FliL